MMPLWTVFFFFFCLQLFHVSFMCLLFIISVSVGLSISGPLMTPLHYDDLPAIQHLKHYIVSENLVCKKCNQWCLLKKWNKLILFHSFFKTCFYGSRAIRSLHSLGFITIHMNEVEISGRKPQVKLQNFCSNILSWNLWLFC